MPRLPRFTTPGYPQHVIQRGNNRSTLFTHTSDYIAFRESMLSALQRYTCELHAYVFMTNHVHLLMSQVRSGSIARVMQSVGGKYARYFNDRYGRTGTLWEGRYRATIVSSDEYLFTCCRYIEENPVRAGMVRDPASYRWSSYAANALGTNDPLVVPHNRYVALGETSVSRQLAYRALFREAIGPSTMVTIRDATNHAWALGGERFRDDLKRDRRATRQRKARRFDPLAALR